MTAENKQHSPFDIATAVSYTKEDVIAFNEEYSQFMVNRALSYFVDSIHFVNIMNMHAQDIDNRLHFDFLRSTLRKRKRFSKWHKYSAPEIVKTIQELYNYSEETAKQAYSILTNEQIDELMELAGKGGLVGKSKKKSGKKK